MSDGLFDSDVFDGLSDMSETHAWPPPAKPRDTVCRCGSYEAMHTWELIQQRIEMSGILGGPAELKTLYYDAERASRSSAEAQHASGKLGEQRKRLLQACLA